jgi:hypothetical protein
MPRAFDRQDGILALDVVMVESVCRKLVLPSRVPAGASATLGTSLTARVERGDELGRTTLPDFLGGNDAVYAISPDKLIMIDECNTVTALSAGD